MWYKSSQVKSSQAIIASGYFDLLDKAQQILSIENILNKVELCDICKYSNKKIDAHSLNKHNYVGVDNLLKNKKGKIESDFVPIKGKVNSFKKDDILIGNIRPYLKKIWMAEYDGGASGDVLIFSIRNEYESKIIPRFLYFNLSSEKFFEYDIGYSKGAKMPRGDKKAIMEYKIPVPPIPVQEHIVSILDKFDELVNDISAGIPKEIELRQKEYEFYREKLLNFPR